MRSLMSRRSGALSLVLVSLLVLLSVSCKAKADIFNAAWNTLLHATMDDGGLRGAVQEGGKRENYRTRQTHLPTRHFP